MNYSDLDPTTFSPIENENIFVSNLGASLKRYKKKNKKGDEEYKESYNTISAADLHNEMTDDVKIMLREYRLALKKNHNKRKDSFRDKIEENIENNKKSKNE